MSNPTLDTAIEKLGEQFAKRNWSYLDVPAGSPMEKSYAWPGQPEENIMICVHKGPDIQEMFHRQDFFFIRYNDSLQPVVNSLSRLFKKLSPF